jgi:cell division septal protein FtsQ
MRSLAKHFAGVLRPALVFLLSFLILGSVIFAYQAIRTIQQLSVVESERDRWQRADDIIRQLDLTPGNTVVDFGSGAGYFASIVRMRPNYLPTFLSCAVTVHDLT